MDMRNDSLITMLRSEGITDEEVLAAINKIPREDFVEKEYKERAYDDIALPIDASQTTSQPYIIAMMIQALHELGPIDNILEIGTGSGYQTAILSLLAKEVHSVERIKSLKQEAEKRLEKLNIDNVSFHYGDGYFGWAEGAPYDAIIVTAATQRIPDALPGQLKDGGRMIIPIGGNYGQQLILITKQGDKFVKQHLAPVIFVPLFSGVE